MVYVEGPSDRAAMQTLLQPLLRQKQQEGFRIDFFTLPPGHNKESLLQKVPGKAANIILNDPNSRVVALPDLYPANINFPHTSCEELQRGLITKFHHALSQRRRDADDGLPDRFHVFCLKHDQESLLLAADEALKNALGVRHLKASWRVPVEDQNFDRPPKRVISELFEMHGKNYVPTKDAPFVLSGADYRQVAARCPQCFEPFVKFLESLRQG